MMLSRSLTFFATLTLLAACGGTPSKQPIDAGSGPTPTLPQPESKVIPTVNVAPAKGWSGEQQPSAANGMAVTRYAADLDHPRWLYVLPNGDVLVAETNAPERPEDKKGIKGFFMGKAQKKAGAGTPSANRITLLRDADGDGRAEFRSEFLKGLNSPFGMALVGNDFYVANTDAVMRYRYRVASSFIDGAGTKVADLPAGPINHHWTKNLIASADGKRLYVTVGSNSNVAENGIDKETGRAAIWEVDPKTGAHRVFASGLRNPNGMAWEPQTGALWTAVNERDELGSDLVPDYMTSVKDGAFYGWPYSYYGQHVDVRVEPPRPDLVAKAIVPDYALGPHTASLGLASSRGTSLPDAYRNGMFVGRHGSWNRKPRSGYDVIFVPFADGKPSGPPLPVLTAFVTEGGDAYGRPVGVALDRRGALLVADDVGNTVWRVTNAAAQRSAATR
jgi:glucose/arabinose dehydrogenase